MTGNRVFVFLLILIAVVIAIIVPFKLIDVLDSESDEVSYAPYAWEVAG